MKTEEWMAYVIAVQLGLLVVAALHLWRSRRAVCTECELRRIEAEAKGPDSVPPRTLFAGQAMSTARAARRAGLRTLKPQRILVGYLCGCSVWAEFTHTPERAP